MKYRLCFLQFWIQCNVCIWKRQEFSTVLFLSLKWFVKSSDKQLSEKSVIVTGFSTYSPTNPVLLCCCSSLGKVLNHHPLLDSWHLHLLLSSLEVGGDKRKCLFLSSSHFMTFDILFSCWNKFIEFKNMPVYSWTIMFDSTFLTELFLYFSLENATTRNITLF